jgi:hypothetical protein
MLLVSIARQVSAAAGLALAALAPRVGVAQALTPGPTGPAAPYGVDARPAPTGTDLRVLLPERVGEFRRAALPSGATPPTDEDLVVNYVAAGDTISFGFSIPGSPRDAWEGVRTTRAEAIKTGIDVRRAAYVLRRDPSYFRTDRFMAWTRGAYFFYADASSPAALDRFMRAFPF